MLYNVTILGREFSWQFGGKFSVAQSAVWNALTANGFDPKLSRVACPRHAFLRALRAWLSAECGGRVDHTISDVLDSRVVETKDALRVQIDDKFVDQMQVKFATRGQVCVDKKTGVVTGTCQSLCDAIEKQIPHFQMNRNSVDMNNLVHRIMEKEVGPMGLIPWHGRGSYFVLVKFNAILDRLMNFIRAIGGAATTVEIYSVKPENATASTPTNGNTEIVVKSLYDHIQELAEVIQASVVSIHQQEWKSEKCKEKKIRRTYGEILVLNDMMQDAREIFNPLPFGFAHIDAVLSDYIVGVKNMLDRIDLGLSLDMSTVQPLQLEESVEY